MFPNFDLQGIKQVHTTIQVFLHDNLIYFRYLSNVSKLLMTSLMWNQRKCTYRKHSNNIKIEVITSDTTKPT